MTSNEARQALPAADRPTNWVRIALYLVLIALLVGGLAYVGLRYLYIAFLAWEYEPYKNLLYQNLQTSDAVASSVALALSFLYAIATTLLIAYAPYVISSHKLFESPKIAGRLVVLFIAWMVVTALPSTLLAMFGGNACFNQATGAAQKWYVEDPTGRITLYDSGGYDSVGRAKSVVTPSVCARYKAQHDGSTAHEISGDLGSIEFFDTATGKARVWYSIDGDGRIRLFDSPGYDPASGDVLRPITKDVVTKLRAQRQALAAPAVQVPAPSLPASPGPSFDCTKANRWAEVRVCQNPQLADADRQMAAFYALRINESVPVYKEHIRATQRAWLSRREECVGAGDAHTCIVQLYNQRISELANAATAANSNYTSVTYQSPTPPPDQTANYPSPSYPLPSDGNVVPQGTYVNRPSSDWEPAPQQQAEQQPTGLLGVLDGIARDNNGGGRDRGRQDFGNGRHSSAGGQRNGQDFENRRQRSDNRRQRLMYGGQGGGHYPRSGNRPVRQNHNQNNGGNRSHGGNRHH